MLEVAALAVGKRALLVYARCPTPFLGVCHFESISKPRVSEAHGMQFENTSSKHMLEWPGTVKATRRFKTQVLNVAVPLPWRECRRHRFNTWVSRELFLVQ